MKSLIRLLLVVPILTSCVRVHYIPEPVRSAASNKRGIDALGIAKYPPRLIARESDPDSALGALDVTFGDPYPNIEEALKTGKISVLRVHLSNATCIRNRVCAPEEIDYTNYRKLEARAEKLSKFCAKYPSLQCYVSPYLEHDEKSQEVVRRWYKILAKAVPNAIPVCSAFTGWCPKGVLIEKHGFKRAAIASPDGLSHFDLNSFVYNEYGGKVTFSWVPESNGRVTGEEGFIAPKKRVNWPTRAIVRQQVRLLRDPEPAPAMPRGCVDVKAPSLIKTNAESYGKGKDDGRGNKLLAILPGIYRDLSVHRVSDNKRVGKLAYYGPFSGGGFRHYIGAPGGSKQNPVKLMNDLGSEWGLLRGGGKCWLFNAIRRLPTYRTAEEQ